MIVSLKSAKALFFSLALPTAIFASGQSIGDLFQERLKSIVVVEYAVETETSRRSALANGVVVNESGLVQLPSHAIPQWAADKQLSDFKAYQPGSLEAFPASYVGCDRVHGWHYIQVSKDLQEKTVPAYRYALATVGIGQSVWGIGIGSKELDFLPYFMRAEVSAMQSLPEPVAFATYDVASPGALVFDDGGAVVGWAGRPVNLERYLTIDGKRYQAYLKKPDQSSVFLSPMSLVGSDGKGIQRPNTERAAWIGLADLVPLDDAEAKRLGIGSRSAVVVGNVLTGSPAARAGLVPQDLVTTVDGAALRHFAPRSVAVAWLEQDIARRKGGDFIDLGILRDGRALKLTIALEQRPDLAREADRHYFSGIGLTIREFVVADAVSLLKQLASDSFPGVVVNFVRINSLADASGLRVGDILSEIDGEALQSYPETVTRLTTMVKSETTPDFRVRVHRGKEAAVLSVALR